MCIKTNITVKSRKEILNTLTNIDSFGGRTFGVLTERPKLGEVSIPDWLWTICGRTINATDVATHSNQFDYMFFDYPTEDEDRTEIPVMYFLKEWVDVNPIGDEDD